MMRRLFLQAVLVCVLTALAAIPASAGLVTDPLGRTGTQLIAVQVSTPGGGLHVCGDIDNCPELRNAPVASPAQADNPAIAPAPSITGGNGQDPIAPQGGTQAAPAPITGDGAINVIYGPIDNDLHGGSALAAAPQIAPGPQVVHLDGGCDADQICEGMDDDQLLGCDDEALHSGNSQTAPALVSRDGANNVYYGPIDDDGRLHQDNPQAVPAQATVDVDCDGFGDNDCDGM